MVTRITADQLEGMKTHEVAELLSNVVLLLRRMPNVECRQLTRQLTTDAPDNETSLENPKEQAPTQNRWTVADLQGKKLAELKQIANALELRYPSKIKKDDLLQKLAFKLSGAHSEQYTIQDI
jgi:hypothetical protein